MIPFPYLDQQTKNPLSIMGGQSSTSFPASPQANMQPSSTPQAQQSALPRMPATTTPFGTNASPFPVAPIAQPIAPAGGKDMNGLYFALAQLGAALAPKDSGIARAGQAVGGMIQQRAYADAANNPNALMPSFLSPEQQTGLMNQRMAGRQDMRLDKQLELAQQQANNQNTQFTQTLQLQQQGQDADNQYRTLMQQGQQQQLHRIKLIIMHVV